MSQKLLQIITWEKLKEMGFTKEDDGSGDPRGIDWNIRNERFHLLVDPWADVKLARVKPDTDFIKLEVDSISDLENVVNWIAP